MLASVEEGSTDEELDFDERDQKQGRAWFGALFELALVDGKLDKDELRFMEHAAQTLGVTRREFQQIRARTRSALYRDSR
ncbi:MAG: hypothetical protein GY723_10455 [bacterium]|nr:hypothetical protein [bacterium]